MTIYNIIFDYAPEIFIITGCIIFPCMLLFVVALSRIFRHRVVAYWDNIEKNVLHYL